METTEISEVMTLPALVENILQEADRAGVSDIHVDPIEDGVLIRFRIDGLLTIQHRLAKASHAGLISRIKILARLRTDLHHLPQDGRLTRAYRGGDIRVSIMPTYYGEAAVLRILKDKPDFAQLQSLGIDAVDAERLLATVSRKRGMILVTGPTGSGKTTTLYSLLRLVANDRLVITIEDPVEYMLSNARQIQVDHDHGLTFVSGLRSILRQDPDVIMVGEIRDTETAQIAMHAALTGHLLFSTLHTNDALSVVIRLLDMGVAPYLISATLETVIAQRLVRKRCQRCHRPSGCMVCNYTGFRGRLAIYEIITMTDALREAISNEPSLSRLRAIAEKEGIRTIVTDGTLKANQGLVDVAEVLSSL